uniref:Rx N-terminal domain-containing protein n=1 Tax=Setaria viridis TaxID=4556 RepID=A0A4U6VKP6_SETVI|nr:uncharacterized protein LOC117843197 isoform X3 [Setaria viridis]TKW30198.1 hypothetical protein SEVIR_2G019800v2 [Setaria viridis]
MAELVSAAIVQETVGQILSGLVQKYEEKEESNEKRNLERLEMAHIRLEAALETSNKWQITDASLLHWRRNLKRAAQECDDTLHKCKQRILEDEQMEQELSETIDIVGIAVKCLQLFAPHFKCNFQNIRNELTQLPNEDFSWGPSFYSDHKEHWNKFNSLFSQLTRPNPFCCKEHGQHEVRHFSNMDMAGLSDGLLEPVIQFALHCHISLPMYRKQKTSLSEDLISLQDYPYLKAGIAFSPHGSLEDMLPVNRSSEIKAIVRKEQHFLHTDITTLEQLEEIMLPKAIDYFRQNAEAMVYQMLWKSKHGFARIQVEKPCMRAWRSSMRRRSTSRGARKRNLFQGDDEELIRGRIRLCHWLDSWFTHVPVRLQRSLRNWIRKEKEILIAAPQLHLEF